MHVLAKHRPTSILQIYRTCIWQPRNSPYLDLQLMHNEASSKSDSISMEHVEGSSGWKTQLNIYGNASSYYGEKTEQLIDGYQANICRLGALMSLFQSSKSSLQNMSPKRRQFKTEDRIISGTLMHKSRPEDNKSIRNVQPSANPSKLIPLQTLSS